MKSTIIKTINIFLILLSISILLSSAYFILKSDDIYANVYINSQEVSHLSKNEAKLLIESKFPLGILHINSEYINEEFPLEKIGYSCDYEKAANQAFCVARDSNIFSNLFKIVSLYLGKTQNINLEITRDDKKFEAFCKEIQDKVKINSKNASISISKKGKISLSRDITGRELDIDNFKKEIEKNINTYKKGNIVIKPPIILKKPKIRYEDLKKINGVIGSFITKYPERNDPSRAYNIKFSAQKVNNRLIMPGETISFMKLIGRVTPENGFRSAFIIKNNKYQKGTGGGICQVSSTLYNALLESGNGIEILERSRHTLPVHYVPKGRDATVADPKPDLVFKNNYSFPLYMVNYAEKGRMISIIYGDISQKI